MPSNEKPITQLLFEMRDGDGTAADAIFERVYAELRKLAGIYLRRERSDHTLQPTALVHEAYMRLMGSDNKDWQSRKHFFNVAAQVMRNILVDHARKHNAGKRGDGRKVSLDDVIEFYQGQDVDLVALDEALTRLEQLDPDQARIVELKFFAGLKTDDVAEIVGVSRATVNREWHKAKMFLRSQFDVAPEL